MRATYNCYSVSKMVDGKRSYGFKVTKPLDCYGSEDDVCERYGFADEWDAWDAAAEYMDKTFGCNNWNF